MSRTYCIIVFLQLLCCAGASESGIFGGKESKPHSRPYMAYLNIGNVLQCGGVLIRDDFVLTAAHCYNSSYEISVLLGAHDVTKAETTQQLIKVARYFPHEDYNKKPYDNDIMLLKLKEKAKLNKYVSVIGLPEKNLKVLPKVDCQVAGWGQIGFNKTVSRVLKEATEKLQDDNQCKNKSPKTFISDHMICTAFDKKKEGTCQGDSGGPLICEGNLWGLTSFGGLDCTDSDDPHVYTKVQHYLPWVQSVMKN